MVGPECKATYWQIVQNEYVRRWAGMGIEISVVICTFNRADLLDGALASMCRQTLPANRFEILVIDNGSTDNTAECVRSYKHQYPNHVICHIYETEQGAGIARNLATRQAQGRFVAFLDDDARASSNFLSQAMDRICAEPQLPLIGLGGQIHPFYTSPKPIWFKDAYELRSWGNKERFLQVGESFSGSNMIWYRSDLLAIGGFAEHFGPKGKMLALGEDTAAFMKAWEQYEKPLFLYLPTLKVLHWVPLYKMNVSYRLKRAFLAGQAVLRQYNRQHGRVYTVLGACKGIVVGGLKALWRCRRYPHWQNWAIEEGRPIMINLGTILAVLGIYVTVRQE